MTPDDLYIIKQTQLELEQMQSKLERYKGDKQPFEQRIDYFKQLLEVFKAKCTDMVLMDIENERIKIWVMTEKAQLDARERELDEREAFTELKDAGQAKEYSLLQLEQIIKENKGL